MPRLHGAQLSHLVGDQHGDIELLSQLHTCHVRLRPFLYAYCGRSLSFLSHLLQPAHQLPQLLLPLRQLSCMHGACKSDEQRMCIARGGNTQRTAPSVVDAHVCRHRVHDHELEGLLCHEGGQRVQQLCSGRHHALEQLNHAQGHGRCCLGLMRTHLLLKGVRARMHYLCTTKCRAQYLSLAHPDLHHLLHTGCSSAHCL